MGKYLRWISLLCAAVLLTSIGGVFALWNYSEHPPEQQSDRVSIIMFPWSYDDHQGHDHQWLIDVIINSEHGLNGPQVTKHHWLWGPQDGSELNQEIYGYSDVHNRVYLGSMGTLAASGLESAFGARSAGVHWILYFPNGHGLVEGNEMYLFTTSENPKSYTDGQLVYPIYRTTVIYEDGKWTQGRIQEGYATSAVYVEKILGSGSGNWLNNQAWDPATWVEGVPPA